jgi:flagellum-specific peptidoglycan hydrolase FlgJ
MSYQVRPGDCLSTIAQRHNLSLSALVRANPQLQNPNLIRAGQLLNVPGTTDSFEPAAAGTRARPPQRREDQPEFSAEVRPAGALPQSSSSFINTIAPGAVEAQRRFGVPASVTIAQAILESGWGRTGLATRDHNLFGIKGEGPAGSTDRRTREFVRGRWVTITAAFRRYHSAAESVVDHARLLATNRAYRAAMSVRDDAHAFARRLQGVYATAPNYAQTLSGLINQYNLEAYDVA